MIQQKKLDDFLDFLVNSYFSFNKQYSFMNIYVKDKEDLRCIELLLNKINNSMNLFHLHVLKHSNELIDEVIEKNIGKTFILLSSFDILNSVNISQNNYYNFIRLEFNDIFEYIDEKKYKKEYKELLFEYSIKTLKEKIEQIKVKDLTTREGYTSRALLQYYNKHKILKDNRKQFNLTNIPSSIFEDLKLISARKDISITTYILNLLYKQVPIDKKEILDDIKKEMKGY